MDEFLKLLNELVQPLIIAVVTVWFKHFLEQKSKKKKTHNKSSKKKNNRCSRKD